MCALLSLQCPATMLLGPARRRAGGVLLGSVTAIVIVRAGGTVLLLEHSRSRNQALGLYQDVTSDAVASSGKGCVWNQRLPQLLQSAGLSIASEEQYLGGTVSKITAVKTWK